MHPLTPPDSHHLAAAIGWLELGNHLEANEELENIAPALRAHPDVLEVRWDVYYAAKKFEMCYDIGEALVSLAPCRPSGWLNRSTPLHFMGRSRESYDLLKPALGLFPDDWAVLYSMACYACVLGGLAEARTLLEKAIELSGNQFFRNRYKAALTKPKTVKESALEDPDLEALWAKIREI